MNDRKSAVMAKESVRDVLTTEIDGAVLMADSGIAIMTKEKGGST